VLSPGQIDPGTNWISISASDYSLLGLKSDGTLWIYGQNAQQSAPQYFTNGGSSGSAPAFVQIGTDQNWQSVYAGQGFFFARKRDGNWWVCGRNEDRQLAQGHALGMDAPAPRPLGFDFEPWAFATGYGNCVLLTKDGTLWTWGERVGSTSQPRAFEKLKDQWNQLMSRLLKRGYSGSGHQPKTDSAPFKIWELPADMCRSLAGNAAITNQSATNAAHMNE
jgi:alpha-tubulin suppressor-like RCC1 family protein